MLFRETALPGVFIVEPEPQADERGFFARTWCRQDFAERGLDISWVQSSISVNPIRGTIRGMHYQADPYPETKLVRCTMGSVHDVVIDLRPDSPTFGRHTGVLLSAENRQALYVPGGLAHGFQILSDHTEVLYLISEFYRPELARGVRWNDPAFGIHWPLAVTMISERDRTFPDFSVELAGSKAGQRG